MSGGVALMGLGIWVLAQVTRGHMLSRLGVLK